MPPRFSRLVNHLFKRTSSPSKSSSYSTSSPSPNPASNPESKFSTYKTFIFSTSRHLFIFATWIPAVIFFNDHVGEFARINGPSMYPYLNEGFDRSLGRDVCWVYKWGVGWNASVGDGKGGLRRGMIVSLRSPTHPEVHATKRIIALPGDTVLTKSPYPVPKVLIPTGHVWVEGDGRSFGKRSLDSNYYGPVPISLVQGKLTWVVWPWRNWGQIKWWEFKSRTVVVKGRE